MLIPPESIVVSLDLARRLKKARYPQRSCSHYWAKDVPDWEKTVSYAVSSRGEFLIPVTGGCKIRLRGTFAAPTAEEILQRLPDYIGTKYVLVTVRDHPKKNWSVNYVAISEKGVSYHPDHEFRARPCEADTLANAAAEMWCYLASKRLLPSVNPT